MANIDFSDAQEIDTSLTSKQEMAFFDASERSSKDTSSNRLPPTPESLSPPPEAVRDHLHELRDPQTRWRPSFHLQPAAGWLNDPCAPGYDPATGLYHVSFQWNPKDNDWGDICWGHATSSDLVTWDIDEQPSLSPGRPYDNLGIFTGCLHPSQDSPLLTCFYTSVNSLPIHHTLPYSRGCESLSIATSSDGGLTWSKQASNPILPGPPLGIDVTGWRDPFVSKWSSMSRLLGKDDDTLYGIVSGGIREKTPTTFIYSICPSNTARWEYLGPLVDIGLNMTPSRWSGDLGKNWEVTNFVTLHDQIDPSITRELLIMGTEGCIEPEPGDGDTVMAPQRPPRCQLWMSGTLQADPAPTMTYSFGGHLDHGSFYAANSFFDPISQSHIVWGWVTEDDLVDELRRPQGWSGMLSLPRRVQMATIPNVVRASRSDLTSITSVEAEPDGRGTFTVRTLTSLPDLRVVERLRERPGVTVSYIPSATLCSSSPLEVPAQKIRSKAWEILCRIRVSRACTKAGFHIGHAQDFSKTTSLCFEPPTETFTISRPSVDSFPKHLVNSLPEKAPHTLFTTIDPASGQEETEVLEIRAWRDNSMMEVFVNERTAITTRIYGGEETFGMRFFAEEADVEGLERREGTRLDHAVIWDGIGL